uniref:Class I SAM-dependent methyltransferase n=1 Tax=Eiseniibacteriota bacterium TaxID=2212470 RepID=A0A832I5T3_UNCEI
MRRVSGAFWDERYSAPGYAYGSQPNDFLAEVAGSIPAGPVLCLAEGEGRNAVHLAGLGHAVTAVDVSRVGLDKAKSLARERGVAIETVCADLADFDIRPAAWSGIVSIWVHLDPALRARVHRACVAGLAPGGALVLEAYTPRQLARGTGGPTDALRLVTLEALRRELAGLDFEIARELEREVHEGRCHHGTSSVVQVLARKPAAR